MARIRGINVEYIVTCILGDEYFVPDQEQDVHMQLAWKTLGTTTQCDRTGVMGTHCRNCIFGKVEEE